MKRPRVADRLRLPELCRKKYALLIDPLRDRAKELGYGIAVHGSLCRDIDLIAVPWTQSAVSVDEFFAEMVKVIEQVNGCAYVRNDENADKYDFTKRNPQ